MKVRSREVFDATQWHDGDVPLPCMIPCRLYPEMCFDRELREKQTDELVPGKYEVIAGFGRRKPVHDGDWLIYRANDEFVE